MVLACESMHVVKVYSFMTRVLPPSSPEYNINFFKRFSLVMNALDNKGTHINIAIHVHVHALYMFVHVQCIL